LSIVYRLSFIDRYPQSAIQNQQSKLARSSVSTAEAGKELTTKERKKDFGVLRV
jgi:hypothetical protein